MDRFLSIQAFVRVAETRSFAEAARQLDLAPSVVTVRIKQLEDYVRAPLFHRTTRHVRLSEVGETYYKECAELVARIESITDSMRETMGSPAGVLRVLALPGLMLGHLSHRLYEFQAHYPEISLDLVVNDRVIDPVEEGFDLALQLFSPANELLVQRKLFPVRRMFVASPQYLAQRGAPRRPEDLLEHKLGLYDRYPTRNRWTFRKGEEVVELTLPAALKSNSVHLLCDYALSHAGIVCVPTMTSAEHVLSGRLAPVLTDYPLSSLTVSAVFAETHRHTLKLRMFLDFLLSTYAGEPEWDARLAAAGVVLPPI
jgi:DNA-binding transcriptional LysR family regulator